MRDLSREAGQVLFNLVPEEAVAKIDYALDCLWGDTEKSYNDKVVRGLDYEELLMALLSAKQRILDDQDR